MDKISYQITLYISTFAIMAIIANISIADTLTAKESDPKVMEWMQGFPPADDKLIMQPDANYLSLIHI